MEFGPVDLDRAEGAILAHSQRVPGARIRKGRVLVADDIAALRGAGLTRVIVARLTLSDLGEDCAARVLAQAMAPDPGAAHVRLGKAATGRVNIHAACPGIVDLDAGAIGALNALDPGITLATLPQFGRVATGQMVATVKIIPYGVAGEIVSRGADILADTLRVRPVRMQTADLIITDMGQGPGKGEAAIAMRLERLGMELTAVNIVPHSADAIARALISASGDMVLLLTASATSDARDVGPSGLIAAGGTLTRFGMPVDPGNLLFLGDLSGRPVIGLPGCARSPALNGADWVLERVACGHMPDTAEIAAMGVGGLLKEPPSRPHPRGGHGDSGHS